MESGHTGESRWAVAAHDASGSHRFDPDRFAVVASGPKGTAAIPDDGITEIGQALDSILDAWYDLAARCDTSAIGQAAQHAEHLAVCMLSMYTGDLEGYDDPDGEDTAGRARCFQHLAVAREFGRLAETITGPETPIVLRASVTHLAKEWMSKLQRTAGYDIPPGLIGDLRRLATLARRLGVGEVADALEAIADRLADIARTDHLEAESAPSKSPPCRTLAPPGRNITAQPRLAAAPPRPDHRRAVNSSCTATGSRLAA